MFLRAATATLFLSLTACADSNEFIRFDTGSRAHLEETDRILVAIPPDSFYPGGLHPESGRNSARVVLAAFTEHTDHTGPLPDASNVGDVRSKAREDNYDYLVMPTIFRWDDEVPDEASGSHRLEVKIDIVELASDKVVASGLAIGRGGSTVSGDDQEDHPLFQPVEGFVESLYR